MFCIQAKVTYCCHWHGVILTEILGKGVCVGKAPPPKGTTGGKAPQLRTRPIREVQGGGGNPTGLVG